MSVLEEEDEEGPQCPICSEHLPRGSSNRALNQHVDRCLLGDEVNGATGDDGEIVIPDHSEDEVEGQEIVIESVRKRPRKEPPKTKLSSRDTKSKSTGKGKGKGNGQGGNKGGGALMSWLRQK